MVAPNCSLLWEKAYLIAVNGILSGCIAIKDTKGQGVVDNLLGERYATDHSFGLE